MKFRVSRSRVVLLVVCLLLLFIIVRACTREEPAAPEAVEVTMEPQDIAVVTLDQISATAVISGSLEAGTEATIRAEVAGTVLEAPAKEGQRVTRGTVIARISDPSLPAALRSARTAVTSAQVAARNAERDVQRFERLVEAGAAARRDLDNARNTLATAATQLANARSQLAELRADQNRPVVQSPINGVVSAKLVSEGDVVQIGTELYRIIDLSTMMLEAMLPADKLGAVAIGAPVDFEVRGLSGYYRGTVQRINPSADPATRQVTIHVSIPNLGGRLVQGLFAQGAVATDTRMGRVVPASAVQETTGRFFATRVRNGVAQQVAVRIGLRDETRQRVEIVAGLEVGDTVLLGPAMEVATGTRIRIERLAVDAPAGARAQ